MKLLPILAPPLAEQLKLYLFPVVSLKPEEIGMRQALPFLPYTLKPSVSQRLVTLGSIGLAGLAFVATNLQLAAQVLSSSHRLYDFLVEQVYLLPLTNVLLPVKPVVLVPDELSLSPPQADNINAEQMTNEPRIFFNIHSL